MENKTSIKIIGEIASGDIKQIKSKLQLLEGVTSVKIEDGVIIYELNEWASDYDVMVKIIETLQELGFDGEPLFEDEYTVEPKAQDEEEHEDEEEEDCKHCNHDHEDCEHEDRKHDGVKCSCHNHEEQKTEKEVKSARKAKIIEISASIVVFIVGAILSLYEKTERASQFVLLASYVIAGYEYVFAGVVGIFKGKVFSENLLMTLASVAAILLGEIHEAAGIMILFSIGSLFESVAVYNSNKYVERLKSLTPDKVTIEVQGVEKKVNLNSVKVSDIVVIKPGEKVGVDGKIIWGSASFDSSAITGESLYKDLSVNDVVLAGYANVNGAVKVEVTKDIKEGTLSKIESAVKSSLEKKAKSEKFIEKFAKIYTPTILALALLLAFIPPIFGGDYLSGLQVWGLRAVMLLCVSCPCALVVSVPLTYYSGIGKAAKNGVLIKSSEALEKLATTKAIAFDKTGTLTVGRPTVKKVISTKKYQGKILEIAGAVERYSNHPLALALKEKVGEITAEVTNYEEIAGKGVKAVYNGQNVIAGNLKFLEENQIKPIESKEVGIKLYLSVDGECAGLIVFTDEPRETAHGAMLELKDAGVNELIMLTGDNREYASTVRKQLEMTRSYSELLPDQKVEKLELVMEEVKGKTVVAVGDGINDAPLLSRADVSVAMGEVGADVTIDSADVVLTNNDLSKVPYLVKLAKRTRSIMLQNVIIAILVKVAVMVLGAVGVTTSLWVAIGADVGVLILAILNAIRNRAKII